MNPIRQAAKHLLTAALPPKLWLARGPRSARAIALTFDDGPHPEHTPRLLDVLRQHALSATFFVVGSAAQRHPDLIRRIVSEGHLLGHHSYTHSEPRQTSAAQLLDEVVRSRALLADITGRECNLFRPPKGELTLAKLTRLWRLGQTIALWNVDPRDYRLADAGPLVRWCRDYRPRGGDVLLMHDNHPHCIAAVGELSQRAEMRDSLEFTTLDHWLPPWTRAAAASPQPVES